MTDSLLRKLGELGDPTLLLLGGFAVFFYLWSDDDRRQAASAWGLTIALCATLTIASKFALYIVGWSHVPALRLQSPSGHVAVATAFYGGCAMLLATGRPGPFRFAVWLVASLLVAMLAASRVMLGLHSVPEIVIGLSIGIACLLVLAKRLARQPAAHNAGQLIALVLLVIVVRVTHVDGEGLVAHMAQQVRSVMNEAPRSGVWPSMRPPYRPALAATLSTGAAMRLSAATVWIRPLARQAAYKKTSVRTWGAGRNDGGGAIGRSCATRTALTTIVGFHGIRGKVGEMPQGSVVFFEQARQVRLAARQMQAVQRCVSIDKTLAGTARAEQGAKASKVVRGRWASVAAGLGASRPSGPTAGHAIAGIPPSARNSFAGFVADHGRTQSAGQAEPWEPAGGDPEQLALQLCRELERLGSEHKAWVDIETLVSRTGLPESVVVAAAVYGHLRGWITYAVSSVMLREQGRRMVKAFSP
jgi:PAP2 superfamily